jgi:sodium pump decarboxylase gamma subunit
MPEIPSVATVVIVGFGLVLAILVVLVLILSVQGKVFQSMDKSKANKAQKVVKAAEVVPVAPPAAAPAPYVEPGIPEEVVVAIAAAIAAMEGGSNYKLRSLTRKKDSRNPWGVAATISYTQLF